MISFIRLYIRSMRLYYCFVTFSTTFLGLAAAHATAPESRPLSLNDGLILAIGFLSWGVNQIFNDYENRREDSVNAPHRPMVAGTLNAKAALALSTILMLVFAAVSYMISPWTLLPVALGGALNILYSPMKGVPLAGCFVYALSISMCAIYGFAGGGGGFTSPHALSVTAFLVCACLPAHFMMCHNSYYKDAAGDEAAGKRTLQTVCGTFTSLVLSYAGSLVYIVACMAVCAVGGRVTAGAVFGLVMILAMARLLFLILDKRFHKATQMNAILCVLEIFALSASYRAFTLLSVICAVVSVFVITLLFKVWYRDEKE